VPASVFAGPLRDENCASCVDGDGVAPEQEHGIQVNHQDVVICNPVRTAIGAYNGSLKTMPATELGSAVISQSILRSGVSADLIDNVVMGNVIQAGNRMNPARQAAVQGGLPVSVPAFTVNRVCGSGAQAIASAAHEVWLGLSRLAVAGGMENMDRAPYLIPNGRWGARMGDTVIQDSMLRDGLNEAFSDEYSGWHTEDLVAKAGLSREEPDRWAARSQQRFARAQAAGRHGRQCAGPVSRSYVDELHLEALARLVAVGVGAVEPGMFGLGPIPAVKQALTRAGWSAQSIDRFEINERSRRFQSSLRGRLREMKNWSTLKAGR
jgi:acetyl-CoA C-acetyltransferase